jgi:hypothetical protein
MAYRVAVIGAGWYGCHVGLSLLSLNMEVDIYEKEARVLHMASGNNQFRLHQGFHYARHHGTRIQSRDGFIRFTERYGSLSSAVNENLYAVPRGSSMIDFDTYKLIMVSSGLTFSEVSAKPDYLTETEGVIRTHERVILLDRARRYFTDRLGSALHFGVPVDAIQELGDELMVNGKRYDYVIDATWGHFGRLPIPVIYEPTLLLYYEGAPQLPALTLVDGPLSSVYPTEDQSIYTLSSVPHTPLGQFDQPEMAIARCSALTSEEVAERRLAMESQILMNLPSFRERFRFMGVQLGVKTKPIGKFDDRSCYVYREGRRFLILSGKIDTIFYATERIISMIAFDHADASDDGKGSMREDILSMQLASSPACSGNDA